MTNVIKMRIVGSVLVITAYFVLVHIHTKIGVLMSMAGDGISLPYFITTKSWDVCIMISFLLVIGFSGLLR